MALKTNCLFGAVAVFWCDCVFLSNVYFLTDSPVTVVFWCSYCYFLMLMLLMLILHPLAHRAICDFGNCVMVENDCSAVIHLAVSNDVTSLGMFYCSKWFKEDGCRLQQSMYTVLLSWFCKNTCKMANSIHLVVHLFWNAAGSQQKTLATGWVSKNLWRC